MALFSFIALLLSLVPASQISTADGGEQDRKILKFPDDFNYAEKEGVYITPADLVLSGWCGPKPCQTAPGSPDSTNLPKR
jgi:hypothetical protein